MKPAMKADVFTLNGDAWRVMLGAEILPSEWNSKGAALTGLQVECRRRNISTVNFRGQRLSARLVGAQQ